MARWVTKRWDEDTAFEPRSEGLQKSSTQNERKGKRPRQEIFEQRSKTPKQRYSTMEDEESVDEDFGDSELDISEIDNDFVIEREEAIQVQNSLRAFTAAEMMP